MRPKLNHGKPCPAQFFSPLLCGLIVILLVNYIPGASAIKARAADLQNSGWTVEEQGGSEPAQPASQAQPVTAGQAQGQPEQLGDVQEQEPTFFDPDSIPDSEPIPNADWVFEIPVKVENIPNQVERLGFTCRVFKWAYGIEGCGRITFGYAKKRVPLVDNAYDGTVVVGVNYDVETDYGEECREFGIENAELYECKMYLIGPDNSWKYPGLKDLTPEWRLADQDKPFQWKTGRHALPGKTPKITRER